MAKTILWTSYESSIGHLREILRVRVLWSGYEKAEERNCCHWGQSGWSVLRGPEAVIMRMNIIKFGETFLWKAATLIFTIEHP